MEDQLYKAIISNTYTAREFQKRLRVLKGYLLAHLFGSSSPDTDRAEMDQEMNWIQSLDQSLFSQIGQKNFYTIFGNLDKRIKSVSLLTIYVAFDMPKDEVTRLGQTLRQTYGADFLFDIRFDPNVIAGTALVWNGIYKDYSVRSHIQAKKSEILTAFRNFMGRTN